jgi:hypothetical protein
MFGIQYREEDHNPHLSWKDKTDLRFSVISSFDSVIVVYIRLSCELSNPNSISKQPMQCFFCRQEQCWGLFCSNIFVLNSRQAVKRNLSGICKQYLCHRYSFYATFHWLIIWFTSWRIDLPLQVLHQWRHCFKRQTQ